MMEAWREPKYTIDARGRSGVMASVSFWLGVIFAVLGIIAGAMHITLGFEPLFWLVLAIAAFVFSLVCSVSWAVGLYLHVIGTKSKEKE